MNNAPTQDRYVDPHVSLKDADVRGNLKYLDGYPVFGLVEFNIWGDCNRRCSFCPVADATVYTHRKEGISLRDYAKVLEDLKNIDYSGVILWSMFSEPTLHKQINELALLTKKLLPNTSLQMTSNGDAFRRRTDKLVTLFDSGVDRINLSLYDGPEQFGEFTKIRKQHGLSTDQIKLRRRYLENGNYGISISNRSGLVNSNMYRDTNEIAITKLPLDKPCYYPFYQVAIDYNGTVLLCPHDWSKEYIAGNAFEISIWDIWRSPKFEIVRNLLANSTRSTNPCRKCDVEGTLIGRENFAAFSTKSDA